MPKGTPTRKVRVCLLSSHPLVLADWQQLLAPADFDLQVRRLESTLVPELKRLSLPKVEVFVTDAHGPRQVTEMLVAGIQEQYPRARQVVVAEKFSEAQAFSFLRLGAKGLLNYAEIGQSLPTALEIVAGGGFWVPRDLLSRFIDSSLGVKRGRHVQPGPANLSPREREVLDALLENLSNKEIASKLHISERTVKFHISSLLSKFSVRRRTDLILLCLQDRPPAL